MKNKNLLNSVIGFCKGFDKNVLAYRWNGKSWEGQRKDTDNKNSHEKK
jgi:hypothetical protein